MVALFQSTPPVKAATIKIWFYAFSVIISIHAAREGGDGNGYGRRCSIVISIHAAREGGDPKSSARRFLVSISIHAAREGGDKSKRETLKRKINFNPRRP